MNAFSPLRESTLAKEGALQCSKFLTLQLLVDEQEMEALLGLDSSLRIFRGAEVTLRGEGELSQEQWLEGYSSYVALLKKGERPCPQDWAPLFSVMWTVEGSTCYALPVGEGQQIVKACRPVIQIQPHSMGYSQLDGKFRPMVRGPHSISWGIQVGYPQIFQEPHSGAVHQVDQSEGFPNTAWFKALQRWVRRETVPTPFILGEKLHSLPMRLGKKCFSWVQNHPQLQELAIEVKGAGDGAV